jgi:hypothetical protein
MSGAAGMAGASGRGGAANGGRGGSAGSAGTGSMAGNKPIGSSCSGSDCVSGATCVEGVCCNNACNGKCMSCLLANTNAPDGMCAAVRAGTIHGSDCNASNPNTCGLDGTCDGSGACRYHGTGTLCGSDSCPQDSSTLTPAPTCNGSGTCTPKAAISCVNYLCNAPSGACRTTCTNNSQCSASAFCGSGSCTAKKAAGSLCSAAAECASGVCSGRCCNPGTACTCPQPSSTNLLPNPGFDTGVGGWNVVPNDGTVSWDPDDATGCPFSGSALVELRAGTTSPVLSSCVAVSSGSQYNVGVRTWSAVTCDIVGFAGPGCTGQASTLNSIISINQEWYDRTYQTEAPTGTASVGMYCHLYDGVVQGSFKIDMAYLSATPTSY